MIKEESNQLGSGILSMQATPSILCSAEKGRVGGFIMRFVITIEPGDARHAFGVVVPDLPGCFSAGDSVDETMDNAREAILLHIEGLFDGGQSIPARRPMEEHQRNPDYAGWIWALVDVDLSRLEMRAKRVNVTIPERVLHRLDQAAHRAGESRSGFLVHAALDYIERRDRPS